MTLVREDFNRLFMLHEDIIVCTKLSSNVGGVVLAGGKSSRMSALIANKAQLEVHQNESLLQHNVRLLQNHCQQVWVSCQEGAPYAHYINVPDVFPQSGPVGGVHASLLYAEKLGLEAVLVLACDMPAVQGALLDKLLQARHEAQKVRGSLQGICTMSSEALPKTPLLTAFFEQEHQRLQTLLAIYEVSALPYFTAALNQDEQKLKISRLIPEERQQRIVYTQGAETENFINLNTPQDVSSFWNNRK